MEDGVMEKMLTCPLMFQVFCDSVWQDKNKKAPPNSELSLTCPSVVKSYVKNVSACQMGNEAA